MVNKRYIKILADLTKDHKICLQIIGEDIPLQNDMIRSKLKLDFRILLYTPYEVEHAGSMIRSSRIHLLCSIYLYYTVASGLLSCQFHIVLHDFLESAG